jgi:hypothetical protein
MLELGALFAARFFVVEICLVKTGEIATIAESVRTIDLSTMENLQGTSFNDDLNPVVGSRRKR